MEAWPTPPGHLLPLINGLDSVTRVAENQWQASCPNPDHLDKTPSFGFRVGDDQPVVASCKKGCSWSAILAGLNQIGVDTRTVASDTTPRTPKAASAPKAVSSAELASVILFRDAPASDKALDRIEFLLTERGLTVDTVAEAGLGYVPRSGRIAIPVRTGGAVVNIRQYLPHASDTDKKFLQVRGHGEARLYGVEHLSGNALPVLFCEGELDALLAQQQSAGQYVAVTGTGGASVPPRDLSALVGREVFVAYDADKAGVDGAKKLQAELVEAGARAFVLDITRLDKRLTYSENHGQDISDYFCAADGTAEVIAAEMERLRGRSRPRFQSVSAAELAAPLTPLRYLVKGAIADNTYGPIAGEKKTLKTQTNLSLALAVASGRPFLNHFEVPSPQGVLMYLGEGGQNPTSRRLQRIAQSMGIDLASLDALRMVFDAGSLTGDEFLSAFEQHVAEASPGLVIIDPLYAFHPPGIEAQNLYERGAMLAQVQQMIPDGATLLIADHFRKTQVGTTLDLDSIAQSGMSAWADSWVIQKHERPPVVDQGEFSIRMQFGSRQWGGAEYIVNWNLGAFDSEVGDHVGDLSVEVQPVSWGATTPARTDDSLAAHILTLLQGEPLQHSKTSVIDTVKARAGAGYDKVNRAFEGLRAEGRLASETVTRARGGTHEKWRLAEREVAPLRLSTEAASGVTSDGSL